MDSMADFFGDELVDEYGDIVKARPGWRERLDEHGISLVLVKPSAELFTVLREAPSGAWPTRTQWPCSW